MSSPIKLSLTSVVCGLLLLGCSRASQLTQANRFTECWRFQSVSDELYSLDFQAVIFPRSGVVAFNDSCRNLRLNMIYNNTQFPIGFDAFQRADENPTELIGIRGHAIVYMVGQEDPDVLTVRVVRLNRADVLTDHDTARLIAAMQAG